MLNKILVMMMVVSLMVMTKVNAEESPQWIQKLESAKNTSQMIVVAGVGQTTAWISMPQKVNGKWQMIMTTPGIIGKKGLGKIKEGDEKTPIGVFHFNRAFGIKDNPGCSAFDYVKVDKNLYWSGDFNYKYNQLVNIKDYPNLDIGNSEHLIDYAEYYNYALNMSYNEECKAGKGSGIFMHCFGPFKPYTGGCVAMPEDKMIFVMQNVQQDCVIVIDYLKKLSPETYYDEWKVE